MVNFFEASLIQVSRLFQVFLLLQVSGTPSVPVTQSVSVVPSAPIFARTRNNSFCVPESSFPLYLEIADQDIDEYNSV